MSDRWFRVLSVAAVVSFAMASFAVAGVLQQNDRIENDRIEAGIQGCARGNDLRRQIVELGEADAALVDDAFDGLAAYAGLSTVERERVDAALAPAFDRQAAAVARINQVNCARVVPGAEKETP